ncbi:MAG: hypothetical protein M3X11_20370, partial [Acidobacteriota bacterium]|nr:hypothetical protein [Acidobacteriota bacterium]
VLCPAQLDGQGSKVSRYRLRRKARQSKMRKSRAETTVKKKFRNRPNAAITQNGGRSSGDPDPLGASMDAGTREGAGGGRRLRGHKIGADLRIAEKHSVVMRFHWNAALHAPPEKKAQGRRGPAARKGQRQHWPRHWAGRNNAKWEEVEIDWYGGEKKKMLVFTRTGLWYRPGYPPVAIRYVITRDPEGKLRDEILACTDLEASAEQIVNWFVMRWGLEVIFEETREHLGMETQRQWSDLAIARTTPILLGLFSLVTMFARKGLAQNGLQVVEYPII